MATERSDRAYEQWLSGQQQFDYFMVGVSISLVGYLGAQVVSFSVGSNPPTLRATAAALLLLSAFSGIKRIQTHLTLMVIMQKRLHAEETGGAHADIAIKGGTHLNTATGKVIGSEEAGMTAQVLGDIAQDLRAAQQKVIPKTEFWGRLRDLFLLLGLAALVAAQWWSGLVGERVAG